MADLFDKFFLALLSDQGVGISHHGDQHVHQKNLDHHYEDDKDRLGQRRVDRLGQRIELRWKNGEFSM